jgi:orotate phosphoribosyltransferase
VARRLGTEFCFTERSTMPGAPGLYQTSYRLSPAFARRVGGLRCAIVDDVMSAGSSLRATYLELQGHGAIPVVAGALLVLGTAGERYFAERALPVEAVARREYELWAPADCHLCRDRVPLEDPSLMAERQRDRAP